MNFTFSNRNHFKYKIIVLNYKLMILYTTIGVKSGVPFYKKTTLNI